MKNFISLTIMTMCFMMMLSLTGCNSNANKAFVPESEKDKADVVEAIVQEEPRPVYGVDLGLSVNWAECNVGANRPEEVGYCVPLGNVTGTRKAPTKRMTNVSGTNADIAVVKMGDGWRMPTGAEMQELLEQCTWTVARVNGRDGFRVTGPTEMSIFLPNTGGNYSFEEAAKLDIKYEPTDDPEGNYWCGTPVDDGFGCNFLYFDTERESVQFMWAQLIFCNAVRAVHEK